MPNSTPDPLVGVFKEAWHAADDRGHQGERTAAGIRAVREDLAKDIESQCRALNHTNACTCDVAASEVRGGRV